MGAYKKRLKQARAPQRTVPICLRADLVSEWEDADRQLRRLQEQDSDSKEGNGAAALVDRIKALQAEMSEHTDTFKLRALGGPAFRALKAQHPPRLDDDKDPVPDDAGWGANRETFFPQLIRRSVFEPVLDEDDWRELLGDDTVERARREAAGEPVEEGLLTEAQSQELGLAAWLLNMGSIDVPFSRAALFATSTTGGA